MFLLTPLRVRALGLELIGLDSARQERMSASFKTKLFAVHFGSVELDIAEIWYDLQQGDFPGACLTPQENSMKGFKRFMIALFFLWTYPRNSFLLATRFNICERYCRGKELYDWIDKIACLYSKKIKWDESIADPSTSEWGFSIDCLDCRAWEPRAHHHFNVDRRMFSKKHNHAAWKYEIILSITESKCMQVVGPVPASVNDMALFRRETKPKLLHLRRFGKNVMGVADSIYLPGRLASQRDEVGMLAIPNSLDEADLKVFKSRIRARHEGFNARIRAFAFLQYTYRGTNPDKHGKCFRAICVMVQYQMDNGSPMFSVD